MRQTICEGVLESTTGNTPSKGASAFISMSNHRCIITGKIIVFIKTQVYCIALVAVNSSCLSASSSIWQKIKIRQKIKIQQKIGIMKPTGAEAGCKEVSNPSHFAQAVIPCQEPVSSPPSPCYPLLGPGLHLLLRAAKSLAHPLLVLEGQDHKST